MKLKLYADNRYLPQGTQHNTLLIPFWGKPPEDPDDPDSGRFDVYAAVGQDYFELAPLSEADLAVAPAAWELPESRALTGQLVEEARRANKPTLLIFWSDSMASIPLKQTLILRTSFYRSRRRLGEFAMPAWSEDFVLKYLDGKLPIRAKTDKPVIGFTGLATTPGCRQRLKQAIKNAVKRAAGLVGLADPNNLTRGHVLRGRALRLLAQSDQVATNFIIRDRFLAGAAQPGAGSAPGFRQKTRREYLQNMVESDYILCVRGAGNFSYRLYETLSCGRIPVFIDTDCPLPYDFAVDWKRYCVWVPEADLPHIAEYVAAFHNRLSAQAFVELQQECRRFWEVWLSPQGFFQHFYLHLEKL